MSAIGDIKSLRVSKHDKLESTRLTRLQLRFKYHADHGGNKSLTEYFAVNNFDAKQHLYMRQRPVLQAAVSLANHASPPTQINNSSYGSVKSHYWNSSDRWSTKQISKTKTADRSWGSYVSDSGIRKRRRLHNRNNSTLSLFMAVINIHSIRLSVLS